MKTFNQFIESADIPYSWQNHEVQYAWQMIQGYISGSVHSLEANHDPKYVLQGLQRLVKSALVDLDYHLANSK